MSINNDTPSRWPASSAQGNTTAVGTRVIVPCVTKLRVSNNREAEHTVRRFGRVTKLVAGAVEVLTDTQEHVVVAAADIEVA
jgi:hypothetical protein